MKPITHTRAAGWGLAVALAGGWGSGFAQTAFTTFSSYNLDGKVTGVVQPCTTTGCLATRYDYNSAGLLSEEDQGSLPASADLSNWSGFQVYTITTYGYDSMGRVISKTVSSGSGAVYKLTQYSYDSVSREQCVAVRMNPSGSMPSACAVSATGVYGQDRITYTTYDPQNHPLVIYRAYGTADQESYATYQYTPNGLEQTIKDANGNLTTLVYDGFDRLSATEYPSKTSAGASDASDEEQCTVHDNDDNCLTRVTRDAQTIRYTYDPLNRLTSKLWPGGTTFYYGYTLQNQRLYASFGGSAGPGACPSSQVVCDTYDGFGDLTSETVNLGATPRTMSYQFDADGDRTYVTYPDGNYPNSNYIKYTYDGLDRLWQVLENGSATLAVYTYDPAGQIEQVSRGNGSPATTYGYDGIQRLNSLSQSLATLQDNVSLSFEHNPADQITGENISNPEYYPLANDATQSYTPNGLNEYATVGNTGFLYDGRGNLKSDGSTSYTYDVENHLLTATGAHTATLTYDPLGRLYSDAAGSTTTSFIYDGDRIAVEYNGSGTVLRRFVYPESGDNPFVWYEGSAVGQASRQYLLDDHEGSIIAVTDGSGTSLAVNQYSPYGLGNSVNMGRFQYTGQAYIPEIGLYYYKARMYDPALGRFMQTDPIGYTDDLDLYAYVGNDPLDRTDPTGQYNCHMTSKTTEVCSYSGEADATAMVAHIAAQGGTIISMTLGGENAQKNESDSPSSSEPKADPSSGTQKIPNDQLKAAPKKRGDAPVGEDGHPVELHHKGQKPDSPLEELTRSDHRGGDNFKKNHENTGDRPSEIDRGQWKRERKDYWEREWDNGRFDDLRGDDDGN